MIGFYNYSVILTYISLASSMFGMTQAIHGRFKTAIVCLAFSGLCDMFDGKIARSMKNRSEDAKSFGIQIDSLCDMVCFGAFPSLICYLLGVRGIIGISIIMLYCTTSVIRLAYFNVMELKETPKKPNEPKYYHGLPITSMAIVLPLTFIIQYFHFVPDFIFRIILHILLLVIGILFIVDFKFCKPKNFTLGILVTIVTIALTFMIFFTQYKIRLR